MTYYLCNQAAFVGVRLPKDIMPGLNVKMALFDQCCGCALLGGELHPAAGGGAQPRPQEFECKAKRTAVVEEPGGDAADRLPR